MEKDIEPRNAIRPVVRPGDWRRCWNCLTEGEPCYDGGTPWCVACGVVDNPSR